MQRLSKILVEAAILVATYDLIQHFWTGRAFFGNPTDLMIVGASYAVLSVVGLVLGSGWHR